jgi:hypothetical protein
MVSLTHHTNNVEPIARQNLATVIVFLLLIYVTLLYFTLLYGDDDDDKNLIALKS